MSPLDIKKLQVELKRVDAAKEEMEQRIMERMEEVQRLEDNIKIQQAKIEEIQAKLVEAKTA
jgi:hypothetical protein